MRIGIATFGASILAFLPVVPFGVAQEKATTGSAASARQPAVIRTTTRLVQVSVVVQDKKGEPIAGLKREDFAVFDEGTAQPITVFASANPAPAALPTPLPPNVFTNRYDLKGQDPGAVTVVLFDRLNTSAVDQSYVRKEILRFLRTLKPQDHVAIYALTSELILLHEFTQDAAALVKAVSQFSPREMAQFDASNPEPFDVPAMHGDFFWMRFQNAVNQANAEIAEQAMVDRTLITSAALQAVAEHVAAVPGRKSLVWVSGGFPLQIGIGVIAPSRIGQSLGPEARKAAEALSRANMAIYPVDITGVAVDSGMSPTNATPGPSSSFFARQNLRDSERFLADATGGKAFYGSNDVRDALTRAFDDGRYAYTIGFYPNHGQWNGRFRKIKVQVATEGAKLRYRHGYVAFGESADDEDRVHAELQEAAVSPVEATSLGMIVSGKAVEPPASRKLELHIGIDPKQLLLEVSQGRLKGAVDLFVLQRDAGGKMLSGEKQHMGVNLDEKQYEYMSHAGMVFDKHVTVEPQAVEVRVVMRDAGSSILGSVVLPVGSFYPEKPEPAAPAKSPS